MSPLARYKAVPENEFAMMELARRVGISVPENGHKNIIRYYSLCAKALFYLNRCLRQLPSTSCLHPSELMHANMPDTIADVVVPDFPTSLFRRLAQLLDISSI